LKNVPLASHSASYERRERELREEKKFSSTFPGWKGGQIGSITFSEGAKREKKRGGILTISPCGFLVGGRRGICINPFLLGLEKAEVPREKKGERSHIRQLWSVKAAYWQGTRKSEKKKEKGKRSLSFPTKKKRVLSDTAIM